MDINFVLEMSNILKEKQKKVNYYKYTGENYKSLLEDINTIRNNINYALDLLDKEQSQRTIDFICGAAHALNGTAQKISDMVFIFTPSNVSLSVENGALQSKFAESLWNKPL